MKILKAISIIVFITFLAIGCGSSGGSDPDPDPTPNPGSNKSATGTYAYDDQTHLLTVNFSSSDFGDCGPSVGTSTSTIVSITSDTMIINSDDAGIQNWSRTGGTSGDMTGTWQMSDDGMSLTLITRADGSLTVTGTIDCGGGSGSGGRGNASLVGTWQMTDIQGAPEPIPSSTLATLVFTDLTYTLTVEGDCEVSGIYTSDASSIVWTSQSQTGNTDSFCDYHEQPHSLTYTVTSTTLIIVEGDVVITATRQ